MVLSPVNYPNLATEFDAKSSEKDGLTLSFSAGYKGAFGLVLEILAQPSGAGHDPFGLACVSPCRSDKLLPTEHVVGQAFPCLYHMQIRQTGLSVLLKTRSLKGLIFMK